jgi:peptidoglycan hydrolase-like protein with peptidoglycan-binding domain
MLTSYLKYGANNDSVQVAKLQNFLNTYEKMNVKVTGIFDKQTESAVSAFQNKYSSDIMGPWNKSTGTGYVYITTLKKINQIACNIPLTLNVTERSMINEVLSRKSSVAKTTIVTPDNSNQIEIKGNSNDNNNTTVFEIETSTDESNTALVSKPTVSGKFWNFIKSLFR